MRVLFVSNNFPPEVNAPAVRLIEHARRWTADGHEVEVLTSNPNFPEGEIYDGYENRLVTDSVDGIDVVRVPMYVAENKGSFKRILSYVSFMISAWWYCRRTNEEPDLVVATSPQFFAGLGGYLISRRLGTPFVLEIRDLWPESIVAVGAMSRNAVIRMFERLEYFLYRKADHIVVVTDSFKRVISSNGIPANKISVLKNGFDVDSLAEPLDAAVLADYEETLGLRGKFVVSYIGTIGMAHGVEIMVDAAEKCTDPDILFMIVGTGAERAKLENLVSERKLSNVLLVDKQPKEMVPYLLSLSSVSLVHLKKSALFKTVIPSKIFEAMALRRPIILGVEGESRDIVEEAGAGIPITPEDADDLLSAVLRLREDSELYDSSAESGFRYVNQFHDRQKLAREYWSILEGTVASAG
ncbi:MAG: glycosyltransferase family 4 protein [Rhodothermales bacterium]|nr:glycosyltransferase family 4 protein [Rhodothermales bacterium]